jgi:hypothetical protein
MNEALVAMRGMTPPFNFGLNDLLTLVGLPSQRSSARLASNAEHLFKSVKTVLDDLYLQAIEKRTSQEFIATRASVFNNYLRLVRGLSDLARAMVAKDVIERLMDESFCEIEAEIREQGALRFGQQVSDQVMFTVWTMRKIRKLLSKLPESGPPPKDSQDADRDFANGFSFHAAWAQFHLDCLMAAIRLDKPIHQEVRSEIEDGLRAAVNAYGLLRQGLDLRDKRIDESITSVSDAPSIWDEEDQTLLNSSMRDLDSEKAA